MTFDRRSDNRLNSDGIRINLHLHGDTLTSCQLVDLSLSSISIITDQILTEGDDVKLDILAPQESITGIKGYVVRCDTSGNRNKIAIKLHSFSTMEKYNTMEIYHKLKYFLTQLDGLISIF